MGSGGILGLDAGLEELLLAMQKNVTNQVLFILTTRPTRCTVVRFV